MRPFTYRLAEDAGSAIRAAALAPQAQPLPPTMAPAHFLAGGTTILDLMKLDAMQPRMLVDINGLQNTYGAIQATPKGLWLGALVRMAEAASNPAVQGDYPVIAQSLHLAASPQLRNMATLGGNVLQRTRCVYFRDPSWPACNKRAPGSGCAALAGINRKHAVLGASDRCIASYPGDFAQALMALDATVDGAGRSLDPPLALSEDPRPRIL
jgi:xanthine dehydrogenase YagS FAD-binding subunit